jgi:hypothetical protein
MTLHINFLGFNHPDNIWWTVKVMELQIKKFSGAAHVLSPFWAQAFPETCLG